MSSLWEEGRAASFRMSPKPPCPGESCLDKTERSWLLSGPLPCFSVAMLWLAGVGISGQLRDLEILKHTQPTTPSSPLQPHNFSFP